MSPRVADAGVRVRLIDEAVALVEAEGSEALTLRRIADEVGTSTMAVYTHFGSMGELRREVKRVGFERLGEAVKSVAETGAPMTDLVRMGWAYRCFGRDNANLYRLMFMEKPLDEEITVGVDIFEYLVDGVRRCVESGEFEVTQPRILALQLWSLVHGLVALELAGLIGAGTVKATFRASTRSLFSGFGARTVATEASLQQNLS